MSFIYKSYGQRINPPPLSNNIHSTHSSSFVTNGSALQGLKTPVSQNSGVLRASALRDLESAGSDITSASSSAFQMDIDGTPVRTWPGHGTESTKQTITPSNNEISSFPSLILPRAAIAALHRLHGLAAKGHVQANLWAFCQATRDDPALPLLVDGYVATTPIASTACLLSASPLSTYAARPDSGPSVLLTTSAAIMAEVSRLETTHALGTYVSWPELVHRLQEETRLRLPGCLPPPGLSARDGFWNDDGLFEACSVDEKLSPSIASCGGIGFKRGWNGMWSSLGLRQRVTSGTSASGDGRGGSTAWSLEKFRQFLRGTGYDAPMTETTSRELPPQPKDNVLEPVTFTQSSPVVNAIDTSNSLTVKHSPGIAATHRQALQQALRAISPPPAPASQAHSLSYTQISERVERRMSAAPADDMDVEDAAPTGLSHQLTGRVLNYKQAILNHGLSETQQLLLQTRLEPLSVEQNTKVESAFSGRGSEDEVLCSKFNVRHTMQIESSFSVVIFPYMSSLPYHT